MKNSQRSAPNASSPSRSACTFAPACTTYVMSAIIIINRNVHIVVQLHVRYIRYPIKNRYIVVIRNALKFWRVKRNLINIWKIIRKLRWRELKKLCSDGMDIDIYLQYSYMIIIYIDLEDEKKLLRYCL
jgi:hypothetical protein